MKYRIIALLCTSLFSTVSLAEMSDIFYNGSCKALTQIGGHHLDVGQCDSADCFGVLMHKSEHCRTSDCVAIVNRNPSACSENDCAVIIEYLKLRTIRPLDSQERAAAINKCVHDGCKSIINNGYPRCPSSPRLVRQDFSEFLKQEPNLALATQEQMIASYIKEVNGAPARGYQAGFQHEKNYTQRMYELKKQEKRGWVPQQPKSAEQLAEEERAREKRREELKKMREEYSDLGYRYRNYKKEMSAQEKVRYKELKNMKEIGGGSSSCTIC